MAASASASDLTTASPSACKRFLFKAVFADPPPPEEPAERRFCRSGSHLRREAMQRVLSDKRPDSGGSYFELPPRGGVNEAAPCVAWSTSYLSTARRCARFVREGRRGVQMWVVWSENLRLIYADWDAETSGCGGEHGSDDATRSVERQEILSIGTDYVEADSFVASFEWKAEDGILTRMEDASHGRLLGPCWMLRLQSGNAADRSQVVSTVWRKLSWHYPGTNTILEAQNLVTAMVESCRQLL